MNKALHDITAERLRQKSVYGWSANHDDKHTNGELAGAASAYAMNASGMLRTRSITPVIINPPPFFMFGKSWWKPSTPRRDLVKAGALILAEIERLDRAADIGATAPVEDDQDDDDDDDEMGRCEQCSKPIRKGDLSQYGGDDMIWLCEEHASTLAETVRWYQDLRKSGEWAEMDYWDDETEFLNDLDRLETDLLTNGDRKMVTPA